MGQNVRIQLVGTLRIEVDGAVRADAGVGGKLGPLGRMALAYLITERARRIPRDELADVLWGEEPPPTWPAALRGVVARVRGALEAAGLETTVASEDGCYFLSGAASIEVDVEAAPAALDLARSALRAGDASRAKELASQVAAQTSGQFLPGIGGAWAERRQAALGEVRLSALELLAEAALVADDPVSAGRAAEEAIALAPLRESAYVRLMAAHAAAGNRAEALRVYERCRRTLAEELGLPPTPATEAAYLQLLADDQPTQPTQPTQPVRPAPSPTPEVRLPTGITSFVGRDEEIRRVTERLGANRLLTLVGMGGVGKSRLALRVATELAGAYPDGVVLVELAALADSSLVAQQVLAALAAPEAPGQPPAEALVRHLAPRRLLLVLDNCEHLVEACAALVDRLLRACHGLSILATSREPLGVDGEAIETVPPLSLPPAEGEDSVAVLLQSEAVRLFVERVAAVTPAFRLTAETGPAVGRICRRLDGIPLAIELAAARARVLSVDEIARRLDDRFGLLVGGPRTAPARHQTLRAALDWSYESLNPAESALLRRLSVFAGGLVLQAAEEVCGASGTDVLEALSGLVDKSLVLVDGSGGTTRYRLLETVRQYAAERLVEHGEQDGLRARHLTWAADLAATAEAALDRGDQAAWLKVLDAEHDNLRVALDWAATATAPQAAEAGARLAAALWRFWEVRGHLSEGRDRLQAWAGRDYVPARLRAKLLNAAGILAQHQRDYQAARSFYEESVVIAQALGDRLATATALHGMANMAYLSGDLGVARQYFEQNLAVAHELGERRMAAASHMNLGVIEQMLFMRRATALEEGADRARRHYEASLADYRALGDRHGMALALENLGSLGPWVGDWEGSRVYHEESMAIRRELGDKLGIATSARFLGRLALRAGESRAARSLHEEYLSIERELGNRPSEAEALTFLAEIAASEGQDGEARQLLEEAVAIQREVGDKNALGWALATLGQVACRQGDLAVARAALEESGALGEELDLDWEPAWAAALLAKVALQEQDFEQAVERCLVALADDASPDRPRVLAVAAEVLAGIAGRRGNLVRTAQLLGARDTLRREMQVFDDRPDPSSSVEDDERAARQALGEAAFTAAWFEGARLGRQELVALLRDVAAQ
jgi:predicted ATPase/DNA-binding SARP family transcriptional activator